jgi:hypothetical protein
LSLPSQAWLLCKPGLFTRLQLEGKEEEKRKAIEALSPLPSLVSPFVCLLVLPFTFSIFYFLSYQFVIFPLSRKGMLGAVLTNKPGLVWTVHKLSSGSGMGFLLCLTFSWRASPLSAWIANVQRKCRD